MPIRKHGSTASTRHSKITGDFGEALVLYWLSKDGFECAPVDHTGIDLIARNPYTGELMGISVKSRSRLRKGSHHESVTIPNENFGKARRACKAFGCTPYFAVVVDAEEEKTVRAFITPMKHLLELFPNRKTGSFWKMGHRDLARLSKHRHVKAISLTYEVLNWWSGKRRL